MTFGALGSKPVTQVVVADTSPLNYLVLIGHADVLSALFERVFVPAIVRDELENPETPQDVRDWIAAPPSWLEVMSQSHETDQPELLRLDEGERAAILLALRMGANLLLMDDREGVSAARSRGLAVTGTIGILDIAATRGLIRLNEAVERLKRISFRYPPDLLNALLARHS